VACMGDRRYVYSLLVGRPEGMKPLGRSGIGRITAKWISQRWDEEARTG